jgi:hypothetical protein
MKTARDSRSRAYRSRRHEQQEGINNCMLTLLKAEKILKLGLTCTQVFYLVGTNINKGICRFVKTDSIKTAISTLLSIKGKRAKVEDIRINEMGGLNTFTDQGIEYISSAEARAFLNCYNQLATSGCNSECRCAEDPNNMWKHFCIHRIAEHLTRVKEKVEAVIAAAHSPVNDFTKLQVTHLVDEAKYNLNKENFVAEIFEENGDTFFKVSELGSIIITSDAQIKILSIVPGSQEKKVRAIIGAIAQLKAALLPPIEPGTRSGYSCSKSEEYRRVREYCQKKYGAKQT